MECGATGLVLLCAVWGATSQYYPWSYGFGHYPLGFGHYHNSFGHGYFHSVKAYPPLPKKTFTIADELKYGPLLNRGLARLYGPGVFPFPGFFPDVSSSTTTEGTQMPQESSGGDSTNRLTAQVSASVSVGTGGSATTTTTGAPPETTSEDEDKVVVDPPNSDCPAGQMRAGGECRDAERK